MAATLDSPITTPSGLVFPNRLVKAAMAEAMADKRNPGENYFKTYTEWASGGWGGILTGNVEVSSFYVGNDSSVIINPQITNATRDSWKRWASASQKDGTPTIVQLVHPGRQALGGERGLFGKNIAPSPIPLSIGNGCLERLLQKLIFGVPKEMSKAEIEEVVQQFATAAKLAYESGFEGIELHGAHGYLLSQFLSPKMNIRTDDYGGTAAKRAKIVIDVIRAIRKEVSASFCVGIKLNSVDVGGSDNLEESLEQFGLIGNEQIDFVEISGGSFEDMSMFKGYDTKSARTLEREAFFLDYASAVRDRFPSVVLMVTGGFRTRKGMRDTLESNACDLIGLARPAAIYPHWPKETILNEKIKDEDATLELNKVNPPWLVKALGVRLINLGYDVTYYTKQIQGMGRGQTPRPPPKA